MGNNFIPQTPVSVEAPAAPPSPVSLPHGLLTDTAATPEFEQKLRLDGRREASNWRLVAKGEPSLILKDKWSEAADWIEKAASELRDNLSKAHPLYDQVQWVVENMRPLRAALRETHSLLKTARTLPQVQLQEPGKAHHVPRAYAAAAGFLRAAGFVFQADGLAAYFAALQEYGSFEVGEFWALRGMLQLVLLQEIGHAIRLLLQSLRDLNGGVEAPPESRSLELPLLLSCLRKIGDTEWKELLEDLSPMERVLREDPSGTYTRMDYESRNLYRGAVQQLARYAGTNELEVARKAVDLARSAQREWSSDARVSERRSHVGYYLVDKGRKILEHQINYQPSLLLQIRQLMSDWPEVVYLVGIELLTLAAMAFVLSGLNVTVPLIPALLLLLLPATEAGVGVMNRLIAFLLPPRPLPKLDFSDGVPVEYTTVVAVPTLLISEPQVRQIVRDLEIRYLANRSANLHFALLTDPPDSSQPFDPNENLVACCSKLIDDLNQKHRHENKGSFFHFHRDRVYNPTQGAWMGWERKRGKLLDFNDLLRQKSDRFPIKIGDLSVLPAVRYVITLDADTELPRESAHRLIGAMAHPLNRAVIDPVTNTVVDGYGILQPRVGISVVSASRSRLASIYSGQTGFDIYTRAVSNVYQDLFGEGSFTGKGIYEVDVFQQVLAKRFPSNSILSHDLIEGAYARAGLVSDVEVIDDYPSHFRAYSRRKHRWVRGDWQIMRWLLPRVPGYDGHKVPNPLSVISRWKILDNLRRSLIEIATFVLLLAGWFFLGGGPVHWTVATLVLMLIPTYVQVALGLLAVGQVEHLGGFLKDTWDGFVASQVGVFLFLAFLAHQTLVTLDAIVRTVVRLTVTHRRLLEWETAAQVEMELKRKTVVDVYLDLMPVVSLMIGLALAIFRPGALPIALPVLVLWACSKLLSRWLNRPLRDERTAITKEHEELLRGAALSTWSFFRVFSNAETNWLIPDNFQEDPPMLAHRLSPTNLGMLLNARLAAYDLGFVTLPEFIRQTESTLKSAKRLPRSHGHFLNWYDTQTLAPVEPLFVSTVDSGNLVCALWTLKQGCLQMRNQPIFQAALWQGIRDHARVLAQAAGPAGVTAEGSEAIEDFQRAIAALDEKAEAWIEALPFLEQKISRLEQVLPCELAGNQVRSWVQETASTLRDLDEMARTLAPWLLPQYRELLETPELRALSDSLSSLSLDSLPGFLADLDQQIEKILEDSQEDPAMRSAAAELRLLLPVCLRAAEELSRRLNRLAEDAGSLAQETDFRFLYDSERKVLSIGYDAAKDHVEESCYELLASEARNAAFAAIAKEDVPQESWFHLGRAHTLCEDERVLFSWSGTMFEYLMPVLWMRTYPSTILEQSLRAVVRCQQKTAASAGIPWGISEAACSRRNKAGQYEYHAFGVPKLALKPRMPEGLVVSPYSTFLALAVDAAGAVRNLRTMSGMGWSGRFGFYEAAEFATGQNQQFEVVRSWMAHHQGMVLLSVANLLAESAIQRRFHDEPLVAATERLLHERVPGTISIDRADQTESHGLVAAGATQPCRNGLPAPQAP